jgi:parallel beta-helix repeat protein
LVLLTAAVLCGCAVGTTGEHLDVAGTEARATGTVVSDVGGEVEYWVQYGRTTTYGSETQHRTVTVDPGVRHTVAVNIADLERSTTYHYRLCARDSQQTGGPGCGEDRQFTTVNVDCGETITADLRLSGDLGCRALSRREGLVVGADGIDINLAGHGVEGIDFAIGNDGGFDDVTIRNGSLFALSVALRLDGASRNRIHDVRAGRLAHPNVSPPTSTGISITGGEDNIVRASRVEAERIGLLATDSSRLLVEGSTGLAAMGSRGPATAVEVRGDLARILRNEFGAGIAVTGAGNRVAGNRVVGQAFGIQVGGEGNVIAENEVRDTAAFFVVPESGDGIVVSSGSTGTILRGNLAISNDEDGIDVRSAGTRLRDNTANDNGDLGIDAVQGVMDRGGNAASGNGNPLQCRNVSCG